MHRTIGVLLGLAACAVALVACGSGAQACSLLPPHCALDIELEHGAWEPGSYSFRFSLDGAHARCDVELLADARLLPPVQCSNPDLASFYRRVGDHLSEPYPSVVSAFGSPREAHVIVERDGVELARATYHPRYEVTEPNGEGCGTCEKAVAILAF